MLSALSLIAADAAHLDRWTILGRLGLALGLGALIGLQRELDGHDAGVRTHALFTLGSAMFGLISVGAFTAFIGARDGTNVSIDVTRIASYVVAGVGFLAGGAIVKQDDRVRGLTTAASMWVAAAIGLGVGVGYVFACVAATVATLGALLLERPLKKLTHSKHSMVVRVTLTSHKPVHELVEEVRLRLGKVGTIRRVQRTEARVEVTIAGVPVAQRDEVLQRLEDGGDVIGLSYDLT